MCIKIDKFLSTFIITENKDIDLKNEQFTQPMEGK